MSSLLAVATECFSLLLKMGSSFQVRIPSLRANTLHKYVRFLKVHIVSVFGTKVEYSLLIVTLRRSL